MHISQNLLSLAVLLTFKNWKIAPRCRIPSGVSLPSVNSLDWPLYYDLYHDSYFSFLSKDWSIVQNGLVRALSLARHRGVSGDPTWEGFPSWEGNLEESQTWIPFPAAWGLLHVWTRGKLPPPLPSASLSSSVSRNSFYYATIENCEKDWIIMTRKKPEGRESLGLRS